MVFKNIVWYSFFFIFISLACKDTRPNKKIHAQPAKTQEQLVAELHSENPTLRAIAITELIQNPPSSLGDTLLQILRNDAFEHVRATAALALAQLKYEASIPFIIENLKKSENRFEDFIYALGEFKAKNAASMMVSYLFHKSLQTQITVMEALSKIQDPSITRPILFKVGTLTEISNQTKMILAELFGNLKNKNTEPYLLNQFSKEVQNLVQGKEYDSSLLSALAEALGKLKSRAASRGLIQVLELENNTAQKQAENALIAIADTNILPLVIKLFYTNARMPAARVYTAVGTYLNPIHVLQILNSASSVADEAAAYVSGHWKLIDARMPLEMKLENPKNMARQEIAIALGWIHDSNSLVILRKVLQEKNGNGRLGAAEALGIFQDKASAKIMHEILLSTDDRKFKIAIIQALAQIQEPTSVKILEKLFYGDPSLALWIMPALSSIPTPQSRQIIEEQLFSTEYSVSRAAFLAYDFKDKPALKTLVKLLAAKEESGDDEFKKNQYIQLIQNKLSKLTGQSFQLSEEWADWLNK